MKKEIQKKILSEKYVGQLERENEYYGRALGIYTRLVRYLCIFAREPMETFGEQITSE